jgi:hypothetical protein
MSRAARFAIDGIRSEFEASAVDWWRAAMIRGSVWSLSLAAALATETAFASDAHDAAAAEALFQDGRARLEAGDLAGACPKLAESLRLDPATGTLIALAACHEKEGKLASAWAEFTDAASRAARDGNAERQQLALARVEQLRPRLSTLTVRVPDAVALTPGLTITRSGRTLGRGEWNVALPVDGGRYLVEVSAPGRAPTQQTADVAPELAAIVIDVHELAVETQNPLPVEIQPLPKPAAPPAPRPAPPRSRGLSQLQWVGVGSGAAGVASLGIGGYFLAQLLSKKAEADPNCGGPKNNKCDAEGGADLEEAGRNGRWSTGFGIAGGVLLATGAGLFLLGRDSGESPQVSLEVGEGNGAVRVTGAF